MNTTRTLFGLMVLAFVGGTALAEEQKWGTVKGRVIFDGDPPSRKEIAAAALNADCKNCAAGGTWSDEWVVDPKTKGVRWVMVWLLDEKGGNKIPIHPKLVKPDPDVVVDQPCCMFEPHVLGIRVGQTLVAKNTSTFGHNVNIIGGADNAVVSGNNVVGTGKTHKVAGWVASNRVVPVQCGIHSWMISYIWVFDHPYFAVTNDKGEFEIENAPVGKYRIVTWHEATGWVSGGKKGVPVEIKADAVTDLGAIKTKPE